MQKITTFLTFDNQAEEVCESLRFGFQEFKDLECQPVW